MSTPTSDSSSDPTKDLSSYPTNDVWIMINHHYAQMEEIIKQCYLKLPGWILHWGILHCNFHWKSCTCMNDMHFIMDFNDELWKEYVQEKVLWLE